MFGFNYYFVCFCFNLYSSSSSFKSTEHRQTKTMQISFIWWWLSVMVVAWFLVTSKESSSFGIILVSFRFLLGGDLWRCGRTGRRTHTYVVISLESFLFKYNCYFNDIVNTVSSPLLYSNLLTFSMYIFFFHYFFFIIYQLQKIEYFIS